MWASAALPILSGEHRIGRRNKNSSLPSPPSSAALAQLHCQNITDLLEPAIDGPPSPESIRAFSQQMRQSSVQDKHQSRHTSSSGSSSLLSLVSSGRPSWEHAFEGPPALSRRSSGRSTNSIMQAPSQRERADSVQLFGKNIFNRKSRLRRDSSAQSFASSSVYSSDMPPDVNSAAPALPAANNIIPSLFSRRRTQRPGSLATDSGRPLISGPYNFQHVTHTDKERLNNLQRSSSAILQTELSTICTSQVPSSGALKGIQAESLRFPDFVSAENLATLDEDSTTTTMGDNVSPRTSIISRRSSQTSPRRRSSMKASLSQELISGQTTPPVPPPRVSSRLSAMSDSIDGCIVDRPQTSAGISERLVESIQEHDGEEEEEEDDEDDGLQMRSGFRESYVLPTEYRFSRILSVGAVAPEDANWPLISPTNTTFDSSLADVPEEEEHVALSQTRSRLSIISTHSSLRGSNSVPLLRQLSLRQAASTPRPRAPSNASETLGRFDFVSTQPAPSDVPEGGDASEFLSRESWEDDIDYCYEHEVEADCNYAWERPSIDLSREDETATPVDFGRGGCRNDDDDDDDEEVLPASPMGLHPGSHYDLPALSPRQPPCRPRNTAASEAFTPVSAVAPTANFSLPRGSSGADLVLQPLKVRTGSTDSTFKESQGFNLSPSLLIPGSDYHRQMHMLDDDRQWYQQEDDSVVTFLPYQEPVLSMDRASTVASSTADSADLHQRRHDSTASAASTSTALTDITRSTSSVNVQGLLVGAAPGESAASVEEKPQLQPHPAPHLRNRFWHARF
ncbi:hypothetical protein MAPG_03323 [Magnaporthiopsis poae ATCC 64411]|uniref:CRIB domain-containing protein n=1 Tax=Magnaporthiopsis poae (strain ATCC 64411 / 73-15) TaxID=644358 RepID=A0A0C4DTQ1_MAGP6|nr:hypothetical protein MAPG_03323 [Magnaporthiopsis poae ATCC 64411]